MTTLQDAGPGGLSVEGSDQPPDDEVSAQDEQEPSPRREVPPPSTRQVLLLWVAALSCLLALWLVAYGLVLSALQEHSSQGRLYGQLREELAGGPDPAPLGGAIAAGQPVAVLAIPALHLSQVVVEGTASAQTMTGPGHRRDTPLPGQVGTSVVYGRAVTFGGPFRDIGRLQVGSTITVVTGQGTFTFKVIDVRRSGDPLPQPLASGSGRLTLVSVEGTGWRSGWAPQSVVYVDAALQGQAQPAPAGRPGSVGAAEKALQSDASNIAILVLWLQALVIVSAAAAWSAIRWGGWQTWLVGFGVVLAVLWGASSTAWALFPNIL